MYAALQAAASPLGHSTMRPVPLPSASGRRDSNPRPSLGKVMRYQLRYVRIPLWESQTLADTPTLVTPGLGEKSPLTAG